MNNIYLNVNDQMNFHLNVPLIVHINGHFNVIINVLMNFTRFDMNIGTSKRRSSGRRLGG